MLEYTGDDPGAGGEQHKFDDEIVLGDVAIFT